MQSVYFSLSIGLNIGIWAATFNMGKYLLIEVHYDE